jgi:adenylosuccinate synthase
MKVDVILGLQWGDERKGKIVDVLTPDYQIVARFQGGPNAGHTLEFEGQKYILKSIPSGIFQEGKINVIGNGVVLDPALFRQEVDALEASGPHLPSPFYFKKSTSYFTDSSIARAAMESSKAIRKLGLPAK